MLNCVHYGSTKQLAYLLLCRLFSCDTRIQKHNNNESFFLSEKEKLFVDVDSQKGKCNLVEVEEGTIPCHNLSRQTN